jgi:ADP-heptose:LPS heptosyltransferase
MGEFDYWVPIMSLPGVLGVTLDKIPLVQNYLTADPDQIKVWQERLGPKYKMRVGFAWTGRKDSWLNQHKSVPFEVMLEMIKANPQYEWINLQIDGSEAEELALAEAGVSRFPGTVASFADSAALMMNLDVVIGVDSANSHLAGALGRPTWIMLNNYATDWRWLIDRDSSPWYSTVRLFRQPSMGDWRSVTKKIGQYLSWFKI